MAGGLKPVNESAWQSYTRLFEMLPLVQQRISDRKRRLFAIACCRRLFDLFTDDRSRRTLEVAERYAEGLVTEEERLFAEDAALEAHVDVRKSRMSSEPVVPWSRQAELITHAAVLVVSVGTFYAEDAADYARLALAAAGSGWKMEEDEEIEQCRLLREVYGPISPVSVDPAWLAANDHTVMKMAQWICDKQAFDDLPFLGDALEDAGCTETAILEHCRQNSAHVRGCWVVDLLLGNT